MIECGVNMFLVVVDVIIMGSVITNILRQSNSTKKFCEISGTSSVRGAEWHTAINNGKNLI